MAHATAADVEARFPRELDDDEKLVVTTRLEDAELRILARIPDLEEQIADGKINEAVLVMVEAEAVLRLIKNPEGYTDESDGNYSYSISTSVASGKLEILSDEWALLGVHSSVFTIVPYVDIPVNCFPPSMWW